MRKITLLGLMALALSALSHEEADAWINFKFGVGLNWNWQSGGNNTLWGLFRNGQPPGNGPAFDPSTCPPPGCNQGGCGGGGNPFGGFGGYGMGMNQPSCCPQQSPGMQQPCVTLPSSEPQKQNPSFPGFQPYQNNEFQYFGGQPSPSNNASADTSHSNQSVMTAKAAYPQYQYHAAYVSPYAASVSMYYPGYSAPTPCYYGNNYYRSYYSPYGR